jgi:hypothetical protein
VDLWKRRRLAAQPTARRLAALPRAVFRLSSSLLFFFLFFFFLLLLLLLRAGRGR